MPQQRTDSRSLQQRCVLTVSDMARALDLSRSRFYSLVESGVFPMPIYMVETRRPFYNEALRDECLEIRRTGLGANGQPVFFYPKRLGPAASAKSSCARRKKPAKPTVDPLVARLVEMLKGLGIDDPQPQAVSSALTVCFPDGVGDRAEGELVAAVFRHLRASG